MATRLFILLLLMLLATSCSLDGRLYTNKVIPYSDDFNSTPVGTKVCYIDDFKVKEPITGYNVSAEWMRSNLLQEAQKAGLKKVYYADLKVFSILLGIYSKKTLIVYGE